MTIISYNLLKMKNSLISTCKPTINNSLLNSNNSNNNSNNN